MSAITFIYWNQTVKENNTRREQRLNMYIYICTHPPSETSRSTTAAGVSPSKPSSAVTAVVMQPPPSDRTSNPKQSNPALRDGSRHVRPMADAAWTVHARICSHCDAAVVVLSASSCHFRSHRRHRRHYRIGIGISSSSISRRVGSSKEGTVIRRKVVREDVTQDGGGGGSGRG